MPIIHIIASLSSIYEIKKKKTFLIRAFSGLSYNNKCLITTQISSSKCTVEAGQSKTNTDQYNTSSYMDCFIYTHQRCGTVVT